MDRRLLVAGIDETEIHVGHDVQDRQDVIAGNGEDILYASNCRALPMRCYQ